MSNVFSFVEDQAAESSVQFWERELDKLKRKQKFATASSKPNVLFQRKTCIL